MITRRKFFSFFGTGIVMAAAPSMVSGIVDYKLDPLAFIEDYYIGYGQGPIEAVYYMHWLKNQLERMVGR